MENMDLELYKEKWRPSFHYSTKNSWLNDPNGLVYFKGVYHLYYQTTPNSVINNGDLHWGHATSKDLIHWIEHTPVLYPDKVGKMWSGTAYVDKNNISGFFDDGEGIIIAYSTDNQNIGIAYSKDGFEYTKLSEDKPILSHPEGVKDFRDPHIFYYPEDGKWKMVIAGGYLRIYESNNLMHWDVCAVQEEYSTECPNLIRTKVYGTNEEKWVFSLCGRDYIVGSFDGKKFIGESERIIMDEGADTYAGITFSNMKDDRTVMISWLNRWWYAKNTPDGCWNGCVTLPIEMRLIKTNDSYRLIQNPVIETKVLRDELIFSDVGREYLHYENPLENVFSNTFELSFGVDITKSSRFEIGLCVGDGDRTRIMFSPETMKLTLDRSESKEGSPELIQKFNPREFIISNDALKDGILSFQIFVDKSNIEMFMCSGYYYFVSRIQPAKTSKGMYILADDKIVTTGIEIYKLKSIW